MDTLRLLDKIKNQDDHIKELTRMLDNVIKIAQENKDITMQTAKNLREFNCFVDNLKNLDLRLN